MGNFNGDFDESFAKGGNSSMKGTSGTQNIKKSQYRVYLAKSIVWLKVEKPLIDGIISKVDFDELMGNFTKYGACEKKSVKRAFTAGEKVETEADGTVELDKKYKLEAKVINLDLVAENELAMWDNTDVVVCLYDEHRKQARFSNLKIHIDLHTGGGTFDNAIFTAEESVAKLSDIELSCRIYE